MNKHASDAAPPDGVEYRAMRLPYDIEGMLPLWRDAGWDQDGENAEGEARRHLTDATSYVAVDSAGICSAAVAMEGTFQCLDTALPLSAVTAVLTASYARKKGHAARLLARLLAAERERGAVVAALGVFDQGYYNRTGFGNAARDNVIVINPAALRTPAAARDALNDPDVRIVPLSLRDSDALYAADLRRYKHHGSCTITKAGYIAGALERIGKKMLGLGIMYKGALVAHFVAQRVSEDKLDILWLIADTLPHYIQLFELIHRLSDQLEQVKMIVPPDIEIYDLIHRPLQSGVIFHGHSFDDLYFWQLRILDLPRAIASISLPRAHPVRFALTIHDPIARYLATEWQGLAGEYTVTLGEHSECRIGAEHALPRLEATINAFSRFWVGAASLRALSISDHFRADARLIDELTRAYVPPPPIRDCDF